MLTGDLRYQIFVSSSWEDLQEERRIVMHSLLQFNCMPAGMELFPASSDYVWDLIKREIDNSDYYIVVLAGRYGSVDQHTGKSYTEMEYDYALSVGKPVAAFVYRDIDSLPKERRETDPQRLAALKQLHEKARQRMVRFWTSPTELQVAVMQSCLHLFTSEPAEGWVRARSARRQQDLERLADLQDQMSSLQSELQLLRRSNPQYHGLLSISTGEGRDDAFQQLRARAKERVVIVGIGMSKITMYARRSLQEQAQRVPIDFLMIDPEFLERDAAFAARLQEFLDIRNFGESARASFDLLRQFALDWNGSDTHSNHMSLKVYSTIPTMSMVMIDPDSPDAELIIEFFLYQSGEHRPRLHVKKGGVGTLFGRIHTEYLRLWSSARRIV